MTTLTPMTLNDLAEVVAIENVSFPVPWTMDMFAAELKQVFSRCLVIRDGATGPVTGYAVYWLTGDEVQLHNIAVAPSARGRRLGEVLVRHMLNEGAAADAIGAFLEVRVSNAAAIKLYERQGFTVVGQRRAYYHDNDEDALVMAASMIPVASRLKEAI